MSIKEALADWNPTPEDLALLNSKEGLKNLFASDPPNPKEALAQTRYQQQLQKRQIELVKLQAWVISKKQKVVILFEGRDAAGKGGAISDFTQHINPRHFRSIALDKPTPDQEGQWYFQRYVNCLPKPGEIVFFDRSWYNRAMVEPVMGFCSQDQYEVFMSQVNDFERMIVQSDTWLFKFYFDITKEEQARRFADIRSSELKKWKMTPIDAKAQKLWDQYTHYETPMLERTHSDHAPWVKIDANDTYSGRLQSMDYVLSKLPYKD
jgi:polyphosphate kinase 2